MDQDTHFLSFAHQLADVSAQAILPSFRQGIDVIHKAGVHDFDPVTQADRAGEQAIRDLLFKTNPEHGIIGEEFGSKNENADYVWVIDPIDGTRSFITGVPVWGTLIGLYHKGKPLIGIMNQPFTQERYWCDGQHAFASWPDHAQQPERKKEYRLKTRTCPALEQAVLVTTGLDFFPEDYERHAFLKVQEKARLTRFSYDCYAYCMLASGHIDLVVEAGLNIYDIAALIPIVEQAGGIITNWSGGSPAQGGQIIASGCQSLHKEALALLAQ